MDEKNCLVNGSSLFFGSRGRGVFFYSNNGLFGEDEDEEV